MLTREPDQRYQTPAEVVAALVPFCNLSPEMPTVLWKPEELAHLTVGHAPKVAQENDLLVDFREAIDHRQRRSVPPLARAIC